jgi:hypothetical protein
MASVYASTPRKKEIQYVGLQVECVLLTVHALPFKTADTSVDPRCQYNTPRLFLHESLQLPPRCVHVLDRKKILDKFDCLALSRPEVTRQRDITHGIVAA